MIGNRIVQFIDNLDRMQQLLFACSFLQALVMLVACRFVGVSVVLFAAMLALDTKRA